jgi:excinuclease ABC subunit C
MLTKKKEITPEVYQISPEELKGKIGRVPTKPGVYQHKNKDGKIIYIGKAKNLRNRVRSYFQHGRPRDAKTNALVRHITDFEVIVTDSEAEALVLENTLIKKHKPKYNILLKDDKSYPYVRVTNEEYPRIFTTRTLIRDGSKYYGPFTEVGQLKRLMRMLRTMYQLRSCDFKISQETIDNKKYKLCLDYQIKKCAGPCEGLIPREAYLDRIKQCVAIINGKTTNVEKGLREEMMQLSEEMEFEEAARVRNRLALLKDYLSRQKVVTAELIDRDVIGISRNEEMACSLIFKIREGKLIGKRHYILKNVVDQPDEALVQRTIEKWYQESDHIPKEINMPCEPEQMEFLNDWLNGLSGKQIQMIVPKIGDKKKFVNMASINAEFTLKEHLLQLAKREQSIPRMVLSLQRDLRMKDPPRHIECFDNSHIQGTELVSSCVVFKDGKPKKSEYRKFKIRTVHQNDDFAAMQEVVERRYTRLVEEKRSLPDLIIVDGGKGQLSNAVEILNKLGILNKVTIVGLAKRLEEIFFPGQKDSVLLPKTSGSLKLIQQARDEAHRFAITFHRQLRDKRTLSTVLTEIEGVGEKTATKLLTQMGSVENIKNAELEELMQHATYKQSKNIYDFFRKEPEDESDK